MFLVAAWRLLKLHQRLSAKHHETFWIEVETTMSPSFLKLKLNQLNKPMKTTGNNDSSEEIVIVASLYGDFGDVLKPFFEKGKTIGKDEIKALLGNDVVYLIPRDNYYDKYAVGVYAANQKLLGFIWMNQAPSIRNWMVNNNKRYVAVHISRINTEERLIMAELPEGMSLDRYYRSAGVDTQWAADLPLVVTSIKQQGLELGLFLLKDELESKTEWDDDIKTRIDNVMQYLDSDLSDSFYGECNDVYKLMRKSPVKKIKEQADCFVQKLASRGAKDRRQWWIEKWLPLYMKDAYEENLMSIFREGKYTLDKVEELLMAAPFDLFKLYKADKVKFVNKLYYSVLPQRVFYRLLTLLTVWEKMKGTEEVRTERDVGALRREYIFNIGSIIMDNHGNINQL